MLATKGSNFAYADKRALITFGGALSNIVPIANLHCLKVIVALVAQGSSILR